MKTTLLKGLLLLFPFFMDMAHAGPRSGISAVKSEKIQLPIVKVYSSEDDGYKFRAYLVKWNHKDIIVTDWTAHTNLNAGDILDIEVLKCDWVHGTKTLDFRIAPVKAAQTEPGG